MCRLQASYLHCACFSQSTSYSLEDFQNHAFILKAIVLLGFTQMFDAIHNSNACLFCFSTLHGPGTVLHGRRSPGGRPARTLGPAGGILQRQLLHPPLKTYHIEAASRT